MTKNGNTDEGAEQHGGNLSWLASRYPQAPRPYIDLSTGINPYAFPLPPCDPGQFHHLPDRADSLLLLPPLRSIIRRKVPKTSYSPPECSR